MSVAKTKISFGLVVYNEEKITSRCLDSIKDVADEILIVHDGECSDRTLEIARRYTDNIFIRERQFGSDPHRIFLLEKAKNNWVFMIDADEYLSEELADFLLLNSLDDELVAAYAFKWPIWDGERYATSNNYRACLFNKKKVWAISLHNFSIQVAGKVCKKDFILEHRPKGCKIGLKLFGGILAERIERDARQYLKGYEKLEKFNEQYISQTFKKQFSRYLKLPIFFAFFNFFKHFLGSYKNIYKDGVNGLKVSIQLGLYQFKLATTIWKIKKKLE